MLDKSEKEIIVKVLEFCRKEKANGAPLIPLNNVRARVAAMTGVSDSTVTRVFKESLQLEQVEKKKRSKRVKLDEMQLQLLRQKICEMNTYQREGATLSKLFKVVKTEMNFTGGRSTLWRILKDIGYKFDKCGTQRKIVLNDGQSQQVQDNQLCQTLENVPL